MENEEYDAERYMLILSGYGHSAISTFLSKNDDRGKEIDGFSTRRLKGLVQRINRELLGNE